MEDNMVEKNLTIFDLQTEILNLITKNGLQDTNFGFTFVNGTMMLINLDTPEFNQALEEVQNRASENMEEISCEENTINTLQEIL